MRTIPYFVIFSILLCFLGSCKEEATFQELTFEPVAHYSVPLEYDQMNFPYIPQWVEENDSSFLVVYDEYKRDLKVYLFPEGDWVKTIPLQPFGNNRDDLLSYFYQNKDSIFVVLNAAYQPHNFHDSTLLMLNDRGEVICDIPLTHAPVWTSAQPDIPHDEVYITKPLGTQLQFDFPYLFIPLARYGYKPGDPELDTIPSATGGVIDLTVPFPNFTLQPTYRPSQGGNYYPGDANNVKLAVNGEKQSVYGFSYTDLLLTYDPGSQMVKRFRAPSTISDTIYPLPLDTFVPAYDRPQNDRSQLAYRNITFDPFRRQFVRRIVYPITNLANASAKTTQKSGIMVLDEDFRKVGEGLYPEGYSFSFATPDGWYFFDYSRSNEAADSMHFTRFEIGTRLAEIDDFKKRAILPAPDKKEGGWRAYVQEFATSSTGPKVVLFVPIDRGCKGCLDYMLDLFVELHPLYNQDGKQSLQCIATSASVTDLEQKLQAHLIDPDVSGLYLDRNELYKSYVEEAFSQGRLLLVNDGKVAEIVVNPSQLATLKTLIQAHLTSEEEV